MPTGQYSLSDAKPIGAYAVADAQPVVTGAHPEATIGAAPSDGIGAKLSAAALNALPGIGAIVGGAMSTPETLGAGTILGASLGAGAGRGLRDLLSEAFGLDAKTSPALKGARIALDTGETALLSAVIPGIVEFAKTPGQSAADLIEALPIPKWMKPDITPVLRKVPAEWILRRPAWQNVVKTVEESPTTTQPTTGTSMTPAPMPPMSPRPSPSSATAPPTPKQPPATDMAGQPSAVSPQAAAERVAAQISPARIANDLGIAARRAGVKITAADDADVLMRISKGADPTQAIADVIAAKPPTDPAAAFAAKFGLPSDAERTFPPNKAGLPTKPGYHGGRPK